MVSLISTIFIKTTKVFHKSQDKGFANPMYNNQPSLLDNLRKIAKENIYSEEPTKKSHENPLYDLMVNIPEEAAKTDPIGKMKYSYFCPTKAL